MAIKESALSLITSIAQGDWVRAVTSAGASRRVTVANLAKAIVESYTGSSLAGSNQSVKAALDSLNSKTTYASYDITDILPLPDRTGRVMKFGSQISMYAQIGSLSLTTGSNTIGTLSNYYPSSITICVCGFVGAGTETGTPVRVTIDMSGVIKCFAPSSLTGTLRFSASYATANNS